MSHSLYGKLHLGQPFGINFRKLIEDLEYKFKAAIKFFLKFTYNNHQLNYAVDTYNNTLLNERTLEIPLINQLIIDFSAAYKKTSKVSILELGNVLSHYPQYNPQNHFKTTQVIIHNIVDKYEIGDNVINIDIMDFQPSQKFDLIISISTLEHIGLDEEDKSQIKSAEAIKYLQTLLNPNGKFIFTIPAGHNSHLDAYITSTLSSQSNAKLTYFKRVNSNNHWIQANVFDFTHAEYNSPYPFANAICLGIIQKS